MQVQLFIPCFVDQLYPQTGMNMVKILEALGCEILFNPNQTCCGQPAFNAGYINESCKVAHKFLNDYNPNLPIVTPSGSCTGFIRNGMKKQLLPKMNSLNETTIIDNVYELTEFINQFLNINHLKLQFPHTITYHDACGALRECGIKEGPRKLIHTIEKIQLIEMKECETCCGFGGTFAVKYEPISVAMAQTKVQSALQTGASYIITTDVSCMMHMQAYINENKLPIETLHIADLMARAMQ
jgi:L-lactate dehydrogenase complex protein LldE